MNKYQHLLLSALLLTASGALPDGATATATENRLPPPTSTGLSEKEINTLSDIQTQLKNTSSIKRKRTIEIQTIALIAAEGSPSMMRYLADKLDVDISQQNYEGETALHLAVKSESVKLVRFLIEEKNLNPNAKTKLDETPLHYAARGHAAREMILCLAGDHEASLSRKNKWKKQTPLEVAIQYNNTEAIQCFVELGEDWSADKETKLAVIESGLNSTNTVFNKYVIDTLLREGSIKQKKQGSKRENIFYSNILRVAIKSSDTNAVAQVIASAPAVIKTIAPTKALEYAIIHAKAPMVHYFLEAYELAPIIGDTPATHLAASYGNIDTVQYLIEKHGTNPLEKNSKGEDVFDCALGRKSSVATIEYLIEKQGMDITRINALGRTALLQATANQNMEIVKYLLNTKGADPRAVDAQKKNIFHLSAGKYPSGTSLLLYLMQKYKPVNMNAVLQSKASISTAIKNLHKVMSECAPIPNKDEDPIGYDNAIGEINTAKNSISCEKTGLRHNIAKLRFP